MKNRIVHITEPAEIKWIATFGEAELVRVNGKLQLRGGSMSDRMEALEWLSRIMPEEEAAK